MPYSLFNLLDTVVVIVIVVEEEGEEIVVLPYTHWKEGRQSRALEQNTILVVSTDELGYSG